MQLMCKPNSNLPELCYRLLILYYRLTNLYDRKRKLINKLIQCTTQKLYILIHVCKFTTSLHEAPGRKAYKSTFPLVHFRLALDEMIRHHYRGLDVAGIDFVIPATLFRSSCCDYLSVAYLQCSSEKCNYFGR